MSLKHFYRLFISISIIPSGRSSHEIGRGYPQRNLYLELERERSCIEGSPPSDNVMFDNQCYATTPSSSNGNSDQDQSYGQRTAGGGGGGGGGRHSHHHQAPNVTPTPGSPTSRLLLEYEMHLRNTLAKGMDAESYSLHTFEALLSQSMENLGKLSVAAPQQASAFIYLPLLSVVVYLFSRFLFFHFAHLLLLVIAFSW